MKKILSYIVVVLLVFTLTERAHSGRQKTDNGAFQDVPPNHWAYAAIQDVSAKGIMLGGPSGMFEPKKVVTRADMAITMKRLLDYVDKNYRKK